MSKNDYRPLAFWSFNGEMDKMEIERQIRMFKEQGFGGFFIHARAGHTIDYFSDEWFEACKWSVDAAEKYGLEVWLYDEDGWPSGFGGGSVYRKGEEYQAKCLVYGEGKLPEKAFFLAAYRRQKNGEYEKISADMEYNESDLICGYKIVPHYTDLLDGKVTEAFIETVYEGYKHHFGNKFGKTIKGVFTDEPQLMECAPYSFVLPDEYQNRYKCDFTDDLWKLWIEGEGYEETRFRYWKLISELFVKSYTEKISLWCEKNGLELTGHFAGEDGLCNQVGKCGDLMSHYIAMRRPGIDHLGKRLIPSVALKQLEGVCDVCNIKYSMSESFGCSGWETSFPEFMRICSYQSMFGVNCITPHLSAYTIYGRRKRDYPAFFSYQEPWWESTGVLFEKIHSCLSENSERNEFKDILFLQPLSDMWSKLNIGMDISQKSKTLSSQYRTTVENLLDAQIDFTVVNLELLNRFKIVKNFLSFNNKNYKAIIVQSENISYAEYEKLKEISDCGVKIVFMNVRPKMINGVVSKENTRKLSSLMGEEIINRREAIVKYAVYKGYYNNFAFYDSDMAIANELVTKCVKTDFGYRFSVMQPKMKCERKLNLCVNGVLDGYASVNGNKIPSDISVDGGKTTVSFKIAYGEKVSIFLSKITVAERHFDYVGKNKVMPYRIKLLNENCLTVDRARFIVDGNVNYVNNLVKHNDYIYKKFFGSKRDIEICGEYQFIADFKKGIPPKVYIAAEVLKNCLITFNGVDISTCNCGFFLDKAISKFEITHLLKNGKNTVCIKTLLKKEMLSADNSEGKFETERNRFIYPYEFESIYIIGDFDVMSKSQYIEHFRYYSIMPEDEVPFIITDITDKKCEELIKQNLWFYCGNAEYLYKFDYKNGERVRLKFEDFSDVTADIYINGNFAGCLTEYPLSVDMTDFLAKGENEIKIISYGHLRNLLGPHHHIKGKINFVGPSSFAGVKGFEDFVNPEITEENTWTDAYSFVPFGNFKVFAEYYSEVK